MLCAKFHLLTNYEAGSIKKSLFILRQISFELHHATLFVISIVSLLDFFIFCSFM